MSTKTKVLNVHADSPDLRDRIYNPTLRLPGKTHNPRPFADRTWAARIKDQGDTSACTGFALSSLVEALVHNAQGTTKAKKPDPISPYMLYFFARKYDEIPGDAEDEGSTARGAMKAWHKHGACKLSLWPRIDTTIKRDGTEWIADAFKTPLGAYYRVDHTSVPDLHAALNETGAIYVTAQTHTGWDKVTRDGHIPFDEKSKNAGGHAFLLVGYDEDGFWIQNSWGPKWANHGFARITYTDWQTNGMDAWIGQLGVNISHLVDDLQFGLNFRRVAGKSSAMAGDQSLLLSSNANLSAQQINPYIIDLENNGTLSDGGQFSTQPDDLHDLLSFYLPRAIDEWKLSESRPIDIAIYAHGGLVPEESAGKTARIWVPALFARKIFPIFLMWESGWSDILKDIARDAFEKVQGAAGATFWGKVIDQATDWWNQRIENLVSGLGTLEWDEMKQNAEAASANPKGGLQLLYQELRQPEHAALLPRLRFHLIGHSAGSILHAYLGAALVGANLNVDGIYFLAPACRIDLFQEKLLPLYQDGRIKAYTQFHLTDEVERQDTCINIYRRSLLYLVSNAFEHNRGTPILGMETFFEKRPSLTRQHPKRAAVWDWIAAPTTSSTDITRRSNSTSHGGFDDDEDTRIAVIERIARRQSAGSAARRRKRR